MEVQAPLSLADISIKLGLVRSIVLKSIRKLSGVGDSLDRCLWWGYLPMVSCQCATALVVNEAIEGYPIGGHIVTMVAIVSLKAPI